MSAVEKVSPAEDIEHALIEGDLSRLQPSQKLAYYMKVCESLGLNPYTKPFDYLRLNGREILYARKDATDQLRKLNRVSIVRLEREQLGDLLVVTASAVAGDGRQDSAIGAVPVQGLKGEALANALMKAETKAKRRVTLSICGLGITDDSEVDSIPGAARAAVDVNGEVIELDGETAEPDEPAYVVTDERGVEDADIVRSADEPIWRRWMKVREEAVGLGVRVEELRLPIDRNDLKAYGSEIALQISQRKKQAAPV